MSNCLVMTVAEYAKMIDQSRGAVYADMGRGKIPNVGCGRSKRIPRAWAERKLGGPVGAGVRVNEISGY